MLNLASERRLVERLRGIFGSGTAGMVKSIEDLYEERHFAVALQASESATSLEDGHGDPAAGHGFVLTS